MKNYLKILPLAALVLLTGLQASAQQGRTQRETNNPNAQRAQNHNQWMMENLDLSPEQQARVQEINQRYDQMMAQVEQPEAASVANNRADVQQIRDKRDQELQQVLSPAQFEEYRQHQRRQGPNHRQAPPAGIQQNAPR